LLIGKRIALPTRVEPKVFFANERTFLSWLNFTVILGGLAVGLLNFGDKVGQISAGLFTLVAMAAMIYALVTFHWRAKSIRMRGQSGFDDRFGPTVLAIALLAAVIVNFVLRVTGAGGDTNKRHNIDGQRVAIQLLDHPRAVPCIFTMSTLRLPEQVLGVEE
jgi:uncharacterized membrane protein YidH (DUF202 family)